MGIFLKKKIKNNKIKYSDFFKNQNILYQNIFTQSAWENKSYGKYYFGLVDVKGNSTQCDNLLYLRLFRKSTVTSDYNELDISVTHLLHMIFYMSFLRVLWPPWLLGSEEVARCAASDTVCVSECGSNESLKYCINQPPCKSKIKKRTTAF